MSDKDFLAELYKRFHLLEQKQETLSHVQKSTGMLEDDGEHDAEAALKS